MKIKHPSKWMIPLTALMISGALILYFLLTVKPAKQESLTIIVTEKQAGQQSGLSHVINEWTTPTVLEETLAVDREIKASDVLETESEPQPDITAENADSQPTSQPTTRVKSHITAEEAAEIANLEIPDAQVLEVELDDDDPPVYEVSLKSESGYFEVDVLAQTGLILSIDQEDIEDDSEDHDRD